MIAYCGGTFDLIHSGHVKMLRWAKDTFGYLVVALNTDEFVERYKGRRPILTYEERAAILKEFKCVNKIVPNIEGEDSKPTLLKVRDHSPDSHIVVVNGSDWTRERLMAQMCLTEQFLDQFDIGIAIYSNSSPLHTTDIKERILRAR